MSLRNKPPHELPKGIGVKPRPPAPPEPSSPAFRMCLASLATNLLLSRTLSETLSTVRSPTKFPTMFPTKFRTKMGREHGHAKHIQRFNAGLCSGCPLGDEGVELPKGINLKGAADLNRRHRRKQGENNFSGVPRDLMAHQQRQRCSWDDVS